MKSLLLGLIALSVTTNIYAGETRVYEKLSSTEASVTIKTEETDGTQAAIYADGKENERFIAELLKDPSSPVYKLAREIEMENCETTSTPPETYVESCGEVTVTEAIRTSFSRGGWAGAYSGYTFFLGFTNEGTGRFFGVSHMVTIHEEAHASTKDDFEYAGVVVKNYSLGSIKKIAEEETEK